MAHGSLKIVLAKVIEVEMPDCLEEGVKSLKEMDMLVRNYHRTSENPSD